MLVSLVYIKEILILNLNGLLVTRQIDNTSPGGCICPIISIATFRDDLDLSIKCSLSLLYL